MEGLRSCCAFVFAILVVIASDVKCGPLKSDSNAARNNADRQQTIDEILAEVPLIDGHNDLAMLIHDNELNQLERIDLNQSLIGIWNVTHTDIPRLRQGRVGAQFWAAYVDCDTQYKDAVRACIEQVDVIRRFIDKYPETFQYVTTVDGIFDAFANGKIGSLIGLEGGHCIDSSLATLRQFYEMGVRYLTITHNCDTPWSDTWSTNPVGRDGLSPFGVKLIDEMNRLGMIVDLSHVSTATMRKALEVSKAPVVFTHSSVYSLCPKGRNVPDDILDLLKFNNGLLMVNFYPGFVTCSNTANVSDVADHVDYVKNRIGVDYVGIGADFDGFTQAPIGLEDVSKYPSLFQELQNRGWTDAQLKQLAGLNLIRVFRAVEQVRRTMHQTTLPKEDLIPAADLGDNTGCRSLTWMSTAPEAAVDKASDTGVMDYVLPTLTTELFVTFVAVILPRIQVMN